MGLSHSSGIGFVEGHILVRPSLFERGYHVNAIHLPLVAFLRDLNDPPVRGPPEITCISPMTSYGG